MSEKSQRALGRSEIPREYRLLSEVNGLKAEFLQRSRAPENIKRTNTTLRVATYNVHFWSDTSDNESSAPWDGQDSVDAMLSVIREVDADVLLLQEYVPGDIEHNGQNIKAGKGLAGLQAMGYVKQIMCAAVPSWFRQPIGNAIFVHARVLTPDFCVNGFAMCSGMQETIGVLPKPEVTSYVQGIHQGFPETRCFATARLRVGADTFILCTTHLDIATESQRLSQIKTILNALDAEIESVKTENRQLRCSSTVESSARESPRDPIVILGGDLNTVSMDDVRALSQLGVCKGYAADRVLNMINRLNDAQKNRYATYGEMLEREGVCAFVANRRRTGYQYFKPALATGEHGVCHTNWNLTKIDHLFIGLCDGRAEYAEEVKQHIHPTVASDHLLVFVDLPADFGVVVELAAESEKSKPNFLAKKLISEDELLSATLLQDESTGLILYFPHFFKLPHAKTNQKLTNNGEGQAPTNNHQGQALAISHEGQAPVTNNREGQAPTNNHQGQAPTNNHQGQAPATSHEGQARTTSHEGQARTTSHEGQALVNGREGGEYMVFVPFRIPKDFSRWNVNAYLPSGQSRSSSGLGTQDTVPQPYRLLKKQDTNYKRRLLPIPYSTTAEQLEFEEADRGQKIFLVVRKSGQFRGFGQPTIPSAQTLIADPQTEFQFFFESNFMAKDTDRGCVCFVVTVEALVGKGFSVLATTKNARAPHRHEYAGPLVKVNAGDQSFEGNTWYPAAGPVRELLSWAWGHCDQRIEGYIAVKREDQDLNGTYRRFAFVQLVPAWVFFLKGSGAGVSFAPKSFNYFMSLSLKYLFEDEALALGELELLRKKQQDQVFPKRQAEVCRLIFEQTNSGDASIETFRAVAQSERLRDSFISASKETFERLFTDFSMYKHGEDMFQIAQQQVNYLSADSLSCYSRSLLKTYRSLDFVFPVADDALVLLPFFGFASDLSGGMQFTRPEANSIPFGTHFYKAMDFDRYLSKVLVEYLTAWTVMHRLQRFMVRNLSQRGSRRKLFNEHPDYVSNTDKKFTLKTPIHTVAYPKAGPQNIDYSNNASWSVVIDATDLDVYDTEQYPVVVPLQTVVQKYKGYLDQFYTLNYTYEQQIGTALGRKHVLSMRGQPQRAKTPDYVDWSTFRFMVEKDVNRYHLDSLERVALIEGSQIPEGDEFEARALELIVGGEEVRKTNKRVAETLKTLLDAPGELAQMAVGMGDLADSGSRFSVPDDQWYSRLLTAFCFQSLPRAKRQELWVQYLEFQLFGESVSSAQLQKQIIDELLRA